MDELARDVLTLARNTLLVNLRFFDAALSQFSLEMRPEGAMATDGRTLICGTPDVLRSYRDEHAAPARDYLHLVMHCVYRHMYQKREVEPRLWNLACDMAVERAISGLELLAVSVRREGKQAELIAPIQEKVGMPTAEKLYHWLLSAGLPEERLAELESFFRADDHSLWYRHAAQPEEGIRQQELFDPGAAAQDVWKDIAVRMQVDMETFARKQGDKALAMMQNLRESNRQSCDYAAFLQKFAARGEQIRTDSEEFDYIFYTYGMNLYGNVPLIEPLEYKNAQPVREFVLAVDLTGLISLEQARRFLRRAWDALQSARGGGVQVCLHLLTCGGAAEPQHVRVTGQEEFEAWLAALTIRKEGAADFRPVFLWADGQLARGAFRNLKGVICFADSVGPFPAKKPARDAVFVLVNDDYSEPAVPPWAIRLVVQKDELNDEHE